MQLEHIRALVKLEWQALNAVIEESLLSSVGFINQLGHAMIQSGGKRLRPLLVLLSAKACGYKGRNDLQLAAVIEFIHTATLLHDDVVDEAVLRRGKPTINADYGNEAAVLLGDFLYSRAFQMLVGVRQMDIMRVLADATNLIAEGEILQLLYKKQYHTLEQDYLKVIHYKTATLFSAAAEIGGLLGQVNLKTQEALRAYGRHLGLAYQLIDDVLDYQAPIELFGKTIGQDFLEGKPTLPLIYCLRQNHPDVKRIEALLNKRSAEQVTEIRPLVESLGGIEYTFRLARDEANCAIENLALLPDTPYRQGMQALAEFAISRTH